MGAHHVVRHWIQRIAVAALSLSAGAGGLAGVAKAQVLSATATPLSGFGVGGWLAPGSNPYLNTNGNQRGIVVNPLTGNLVMPSRNGDPVGNQVVILNGTTGAVEKLMNMDGVGGLGTGFFPINLPGVGTDGAIYVGDLTVNATTPFSVYKWDSESSTSAPTVAYRALTGVARTGDSFAVFGGGATAQFAAAGSTNVSASNFVNGLLDGSNSSTAYLSIPGTTTTSNDYRLGMTYVDANTIIGTQGGIPPRITSFDGTAATVDASVALAGELFGTVRQTAFLELEGTSILATLESGNGNVRISNIDDPTAPASLLSQGFVNNYSASVGSNGNGTGGIAWGNVVDNGDFTYTVPLYAMNSNQGIQAFSVTFQAVPEPSTWAMLATGATACGWAVTWRKRRRKQLTVASETIEA